MRARTLWLAALLVPLVSLGQDDSEDVKDHPDVPRFPGFFIVGGTHQEFSSFEFRIADDKTVTKEGRFWHIDYGLKEGAKQPGALELTRNYENAAKKKGGKAVYRYDESGDSQVTLQIPLGKSERWIFVEGSDQGRALSLDIIDVKQMEQQIEMSATEMLDALNKNGFVALHGILFDTGKDTLKPESEPLLKEVAALLEQNASLKLSVEGHTDNVGQAAANKALSEKRAASVKKWLTAHRVAAARLSTRGWGDGKPVADNRTEDGRAQNRRVELVKQ